jgi:Zn-dependent M28 family amino/carboxypeptidase
LRSAGYTPVIQEFDFPFYRELSPAQLAQTVPDATTYSNPADFSAMTYSGSGNVTAAVVPVDTTVTATDTSTSGCEAADFAGFTPGSIALVQRGTCTFGVKAANAQAAGAAGVIVFNRGTAGATAAIAGTLGAPDYNIPVVGASFALGVDLADPAGTVVNLVTDTESAIRPTWNVTAETKTGDPNNVVMVGAHLDSVVVGPGNNDNGSGSATILEVAKRITKYPTTQKVRFAWWGAEELGLLGSRFYVNDLATNAPAELAKIKMYLNFDMIGSPNYVRFIYDGDNSAFPVGPGAAAGPSGSGDIEKTFTDYFADVAGIPSAETPFSGRSDYGPFIAVGIPAGGLFTGAEGIKTAEQAAIFGGTAGVAYDVCYHQACDTVTGVNVQAIDEMSDAVAHATITYAKSIDSLSTSPLARVGQAPLGNVERQRAELHPHHDEVVAE